MLVQCAQYILGHHGEDSSLQRWGRPSLDDAQAGGNGPQCAEHLDRAVARFVTLDIPVRRAKGLPDDPVEIRVAVRRASCNVGVRGLRSDRRSEQYGGECEGDRGNLGRLRHG